MPGDRKFDLGDYVEVKDRIRILYELYPQARLVTDEVTILTAPDNKQRVMVKAFAYRNPTDTHPGVGYSWMELPGTTSYTKGSELENTETSAWGRAIASLGILIDASIATAQEIDNKQRETPEERPTVPGIIGTRDHPAPEPIRTDDGGLIGVAAVKKPAKGKGLNDSDFQLRETKDGPRLSFRLEQGKKGIKVVVNGPLAEALALVADEVLGHRVICWGSVHDETFVNSEGVTITYQVMTLDRIQAPEFTLPMVEAESVPLFDAGDLERLDAELAS